MTRSQCLVARLTALALVVASVSPAMARTPSDLRDLVGARGGQAEGALQSRGYSLARQEQGDNASLTYWTHGDQCVLIKTSDGRYASIDGVDPAECQAPAASGPSKGAMAAMGLAAVGVVAALAAHNHHKHEKADERREQDQREADYSRGYDDGLSGARYDRQDSEGYHSGYQAGEADRHQRRPSFRPRLHHVPHAAERACAERGDGYLNVPAGSSVPVDAQEVGDGRYRITVMSGQYRARCSVDARGRVTDMSPF